MASMEIPNMAGRGMPCPLKQGALNAMHYKHVKHPVETIARQVRCALDPGVPRGWLFGSVCVVGRPLCARRGLRPVPDPRALARSPCARRRTATSRSRSRTSGR